jgi:thiamine biosynthesis lipoprotein
VGIGHCRHGTEAPPAPGPPSPSHRRCGQRRRWGRAGRRARRAGGDAPGDHRRHGDDAHHGRELVDELVFDVEELVDHDVDDGRRGDPVDDRRHDVERQLSVRAVERRFRAMGTDGHVIVVGGPEHLAADAVARIDDLERRWSRFIPTSEVSRLNERAGSLVVVSADTRLLVERAVEGWRMTGGGFDPLLLPSLLDAGYRFDFTELTPSGHQITVTSAAPRPFLACTDIEVGDQWLRLPEGAGFDPGGIGKGLAADLVVDELLAAGAEGACVNLGGDLRVAGPAPAGPWTVALEHTWCAQPFVLLGLGSGAVATSTTLRRRWTTTDGTEQHHLIDPATGRPSTSDLTQATVLAGQAWVAEIMAKAVLLRGSGRAFDILPAGVEALTVDDRGAVAVTAHITDYTGGTRVPEVLAR